jgi:hypothetical protein
MSSLCKSYRVQEFHRLRTQAMRLSCVYAKLIKFLSIQFPNIAQLLQLQAACDLERPVGLLAATARLDLNAVLASRTRTHGLYVVR